MQSKMIVPALLLTLLSLPAVVSAADPAAGSRPAAPGVDNSSRFYTKQSDTGSTVLGNGAAEDGATPLALRAPAVVGGTGVGTASRSGRPGAEAVSAALSGTAPSVDYNSTAVRDDLKQREEKLAQRMAQMYHRKSGLGANGGSAAPAAGGSTPVGAPGSKATTAIGN